MSGVESREERGQRLLEVVIGPCTREETDEYAVRLQELLDEHLPELYAATAASYSVEPVVPKVALEAALRERDEADFDRGVKEAAHAEQIQRCREYEGLLVARAEAAESQLAKLQEALGEIDRESNHKHYWPGSDQSALRIINRIARAALSTPTEGQ